MFKDYKSLVRSLVFILCVSLGMASCTNLPDDYTALRISAPLSDSEYESLWSDTITPPSNPLAPALNNDMVTVRGSLHLDGLRWDGELYACIYSYTHTYYLMTRRIDGNGSEDLQFWQLDAPMLQIGYAGMTDTICVGDTIAVTGYPYSLFNRTATGLDVCFVQKYSSQTEH